MSECKKAFFILLALSHLVCLSVRVEGPCCRHLVAGLHSPFFLCPNEAEHEMAHQGILVLLFVCRRKCRTRNDCDIAINTTIAMNSSCPRVYWHSSRFHFLFLLLTSLLSDSLRGFHITRVVLLLSIHFFCLCLTLFRSSSYMYKKRDPLDDRVCL